MNLVEDLLKRKIGTTEPSGWASAEGVIVTPSSKGVVLARNQGEHADQFHTSVSELPDGDYTLRVKVQKISHDCLVLIDKRIVARSTVELSADIPLRLEGSPIRIEVKCTESFLASCLIAQMKILRDDKTFR